MKNYYLEQEKDIAQLLFMIIIKEKEVYYKSY